MGKSVFLIFYDDPLDEETLEKLRAAYPTPALQQHSTTIFFVETDDLSGVVKSKAYIGEGDKTGALFRLGKIYGGYTDKLLWEWMANTDFLKEDK